MYLYGDAYYFKVTNDSGSSIIPETPIYSGPALIPGTRYVFMIQYDLTAGSTKFYINGVKVGSTLTQTGIRNPANIGVLAIGYGATSANPDAIFDNVIIYPSTTLPVGFTPGQTLYQYSINNPSLIETAEFLCNSISSITDVSSYTGSDLVKYVLNIDGTDKYWNGTAWATSTNYSQSNILADINTNIAALNLLINLGVTAKIKAYLHSTTGWTTPMLTSNTASYSFLGGSNYAIPSCVIWGYTMDETGTILPNVVVTATLKNSVELLGNVLMKGSTSITSNSIGYWELILPQTIAYNFQFEIPLGTILYKESNLLIPVQTFANYDSLQKA
jgi:hypothetical protein